MRPRRFTQSQLGICRSLCFSSVLRAEVAAAYSSTQSDPARAATETNLVYVLSKLPLINTQGHLHMNSSIVSVAASTSVIETLVPAAVSSCSCRWLFQRDAISAPALSSLLRCSLLGFHVGARGAHPRSLHISGVGVKHIRRDKA
jgi:hypothetical protein